MIRKTVIGYLLTISLGWFYLPASAQQAGTQTLHAGAMLVNTRVKDDGMSALVYAGNLPGITLGADFKNGRFAQQVSVSYQQGSLGNDVNSSTVRSKTISLKYTALWHLFNLVGADINSGLASETFFATRSHEQFVNNSRFFEFVSSAALALQAQYSIGNRKPFVIKTGITCPLVSAVSRSNFSGNRVSNVQQPAFSAYLDNLYLTSFAGFSAVNWSGSLEKQIDDHSKISVGYQWNYYHLKQDSEVSSASHQFIIGYSIQL